MGLSDQRTADEVLQASHAREWAHDWQYGIVWRFAKAGTPHSPDGPPTGEGWELNIDTRDGGLEERSPAWSDGSIVQLLTHWRRPSPGMRGQMLNQRIHVQIPGDDDPRPL